MSTWRIKIEGESRLDRLDTLSSVARHALAGETPITSEEAHEVADRLESVMRTLPQYENVGVTFQADDSRDSSTRCHADSWKSRILSTLSSIPCPQGVKSSLSSIFGGKHGRKQIPTITIAVCPRKEPTKFKLFAGTSGRSPTAEFGISRGDIKSLPGFSSGVASLAVSAEAIPWHGGKKGREASGSTPAGLTCRLSSYLSRGLAKSRYNLTAGISARDERSSELPISLETQEVYVSAVDIWPAFNRAGIQSADVKLSAGRQTLRTLWEASPLEGQGESINILDCCIPSCFRVSCTESVAGTAAHAQAVGIPMNWNATVRQSIAYAPDSLRLFGTISARARTIAEFPISQNTRLAARAEANLALSSLRNAVLLQDRAWAPEVPGFFAYRPGQRSSAGLNLGGDACTHGRVWLETYLVRSLLDRFPSLRKEPDSSRPNPVSSRLLGFASNLFLASGVDAAAIASFSAVEGVECISSIWAGLGASFGGKKGMLVSGWPLCGPHGVGRAMGLLLE